MANRPKVTDLAIMPQYREEMLPEQNPKSLWHYLHTLAQPKEGRNPKYISPTGLLISPRRSGFQPL
jgi:hypothetical protein